MTRSMFKTAGVVFLLTATGAFGIERVWTGGGGDALWSTAANWNTGMPVSGDTLVFAGATGLASTNDLAAGTAFGGLVFAKGAGAFSLNGNAVTLDGDIQSEASTATVALPLVLSGDRLCLASNAILTLSGTISGPGGLRFEGRWGSTNTFNLTGDNTFEGPVVVTNQTSLQIYSSTALGSTAAGTTVYGANQTRLELYGGLTLGERLTFLGTDAAPNYYPCLRSWNGTNVINAPIYMSSASARFRVYDNALILRGGVINPDNAGGLNLEASPGTELMVTNRPLFVGYGGYINVQYGRIVLAEPGNTYGTLSILGGGTVRTDAPNALSPYGVVTYGVTWSTTTMNTLDLNGFGQTIGGLYPQYTQACGYFAVTSAAPAVLTMKQRSTTPFRGDIAGAVSLFKSGNTTFTLTNTVPMTATRPVTVSTGKLELGNTAGSPGSFGSIPGVLILPGGTLTLNNGAGLPDTSEVSVQAGGKVDVRTGVTETVARLYLNGVQQAAGTWGKTGSGAANIDDTVFTGGTGLLNVTEAPGATYPDVTWDVGGGAAIGMTVAANWAGDAVPSFSGYERGIFSVGTQAGVDTAASFYKMTINTNVDFYLRDNGGSLTLGRGGVEAKSQTTTRCYHRIYAPVALACDQFLNVTNSDLMFENALSDGGGGFGLNVYSPFTGSSTYYAVNLDTNNAYAGKTVVGTNSYINIRSDQALGGTANDTLADFGGYIQLAPTAVPGITVAEPFVLDGDLQTGYGGNLRNNSGSNVISGPISGLNNSARIGSRASAAKLVIAGGISADVPGIFVLATDGGGTITLREKPTFAQSLYLNGKSVGMVIVDVGGNVARTCYVNGRARFDVPNAFEYLGLIAFGNDGFTGSLDLNGCDLTTRALTTDFRCTNGVITSDAPATLTVDQKSNQYFSGRFAGAVSLVKLGPGNLMMTNSTALTTTTSGGFTVRDGTLTLGGTAATFGPNATNITVEGSGTLALAQTNTSMLSDDATVRLPAAGAGMAKISLAAGVAETIGWLYCGDRLMKPGSHGATGSGARYVDDTRFSGAGVLNVRHGTQTGTLIQFQ